tara:strand:+ start:185 stop:373 length:189 start_codon:yes stop_codon:yes gene_type:complete
MTKHADCTKQCSLSTFLKRDEEACEGDYCELQELTDGLYAPLPITSWLDYPLVVRPEKKETE